MHMKYAKMLGLLAVAAAALMAFAGAASATVLTSPAGTQYGAEKEIKASTEGLAVLHSENAPTAFTVECEGSVEGVIEKGGSGAETVSGPITKGKLTFTPCQNGATVVVGKEGSLEVHTNAEISNGNGTLTSSGAEITIHVPVLNIKCIYTTNNTDVGTLTGSKNQVGEDKRATLDINSATIPRTGGSAFCGTGGFWTGSYRVTTPTYLDVD
jgi:hypothetical protein